MDQAGAETTNNNPIEPRFEAAISIHALTITHSGADTVTIDELPAGTAKETSSESDPKYSIPRQTLFALICSQILTFCHMSAFNGSYLIIPFYLVSTPENGWTVSDLSIIFTANNIGQIVASQICMVAECSKSHRNAILFIGHLMQFVMGIIGFTIMSSFFGFNLTLFCIAAFLLGLCADITTMQVFR